MEDYQALDRSNKELKEENRKLGETVQKLKVELSHAQQYDGAIQFLKDTSM